MAVLGRKSLLLAVSLLVCLADAGPDVPDRQHRAGFQKLRLSTARGFGKRTPPGLTFLGQPSQEPAEPLYALHLCIPKTSSQHLAAIRRSKSSEARSYNSQRWET